MEDSSVDDLRQRGNYEFQKGNLDNALALYTAAIEKASSNNSNSNDAALVANLCNRSACYFQLEELESAMQDALQAWTVSKECNVKAAYRLSKTFLALGEPGKAVPVLNTALTIPDLQAQETTSLQDLLQQARAKLDEPEAPVEHTIKGINRPISIREFVKGKSLGVGNFSEIIVVTHKVTQERFALKILEKKQAADLAKRQHPNVYNEIAMEARVLLERLPPCPRVITMYHAFQDYNSLYYLMDLHDTNTDLWSCLRYKGHMVGAHPSMTKRWLLQIIDALEHMHKHGIVHRDLKPENILKNSRNHVVVIDLGTAKDLIQTDLNGPEFVGTPDFMPPEAVTGFSGMPGDDPDNKDTKSSGANQTADLWALGAVAYILNTGSCPFWSPSPYLTFLRIKRGLLPRDAWALPDDDAWDFCASLMTVDPSQRIGADCFQVSDRKVTVHKGYDVLRNHPYLAAAQKEESSSLHVIPSLQDLALRECAELVKLDAVDLDLCDQHPPGDKSSHDLLRLSERQRNLVLHVLDKCKVFKDGDETRVFHRFFDNDIDYIKAKVRPTSRDFVGLTQMNDDEYKPKSQRGSEDPYATKIEPIPTKVAILRNPWLGTDEQQPATPEQEKMWLKGWKNTIAHINKQRPKAVVVCAPHIPPKYWKFMSRIRDSIPVIWNDGSVFYSFWLNGFQGIVIQKSGFSELGADGSKRSIEDTLQMKWLREQMEQARMAKQQLFCFCDCNPKDLPALVLKRLARGRVLCLYGVSKNEEEDLDYKLSYAPNEKVGDDDVSVKSTDSQEDENDAQTMRVIASSRNGLEWLTVDEKEKWMTSFEAIDMPSTST